LSGAQPGDFPHLPHAPGLRMLCSSLDWDVVIQSNLRVYILI
jgi:hypothetical protein